MSAPSDGARADARKRLAAQTIPLALPDLLAEVSWDIEFGGRSFSDQARLILASDWLAGVIADAKAEALEHAADLMRTRIRVQAGSVFASEVVAVVDRLAREARKRSDS